MTAYLHGVEVLELTTGTRAITAAASSIIGLVGTAPFADATAFPLDTPVLVTTAAQAKALTATLAANAALDAEGTLPTAIQAIFDQAKTPVVVVRVDTAATPTLQAVEVIGDAAARSGVYALLAAQAMTGAKPKVLIATGFTHQVTDADEANGVVAALKGVADKLRAIVIADGPNDTDAAALAKAEVEGGQRVYHVDPHVKVTARTGVIVARPSSAHIAGLIARTDQANGFWWSPSNQEINGIVGIARPVEFGLSDPSTSANLLNEGGVATIVASSGFRLWGNRTNAADPQWAFLAVRRTADMIYEAIEQSYLWAMDRPMSANLISDVLNTVEEYGRSLKARGAVLGFRAWVDPELNTPAALMAGNLFINFDIEPPAPVDRLTFTAQRNSGYYDELVDASSRLVA